MRESRLKKINPSHSLLIEIECQRCGFVCVILGKSLSLLRFTFLTCKGRTLDYWLEFIVPSLCTRNHVNHFNCIVSFNPQEAHTIFYI